jgi:hypothetical protein
MQLTNTQQVSWELTDDDRQQPKIRNKFNLDDFLLAAFNEQSLGETPPESDLSDWFPPPPRMTEWELYELTDWVEIEAEKCLASLK